MIKISYLPHIEEHYYYCFECSLSARIVSSCDSDQCSMNVLSHKLWSRHSNGCHPFRDRAFQIAVRNIDDIRRRSDLSRPLLLFDQITLWLFHVTSPLWQRYRSIRKGRMNFKNSEKKMYLEIECCSAWSGALHSTELWGKYFVRFATTTNASHSNNSSLDS